MNLWILNRKNTAMLDFKENFCEEQAGKYNQKSEESILEH